MDQQAEQPTAERAAVASDLTLWGTPRDRTSRQAAQVGLLFGPGAVAMTPVVGTILGSAERGDDRTFALGCLCILALTHLISAAACVHTIVDRWWRPKPSWLVFPLWLYWLVLVVALFRG